MGLPDRLLQGDKTPRRTASRQRLFSEATLEAVAVEMDELNDTLDFEYRLLAECFAALPRPDQQMMEQRYRPKGSPREIATELGLPVKRVYKSLDRIRKVLLGCVTRKMTMEGDRK